DAKNEPVRVAALRLAGAWHLDAARPELEKIAGAADSSRAARAAAIEGLVSLGGDASTEFLRKLASPPRDEKVRRMGVTGLASLDLKDAATRAAELLTAGKSDEDPSPILAAFLGREGGPDALASAIGS